MPNTRARRSPIERAIGPTSSAKESTDSRPVRERTPIPPGT